MPPKVAVSYQNCTSLQQNWFLAKHPTSKCIVPHTGLLHLGNLPVAKFKIAQFVNLVASASSKENAYLRNVVENCEGETGENEPEQKEETDDGFVNVAIFDVAQTVAWDVVAQPDGGNGDEDEVGGVQKRPLVLQDEEHQAWKDDWEKKIYVRAE